MKELEQHEKLPQLNKVELNVQQKKQIEHQLMGVLTPQKGHKVWELNEETGEIKEAQYHKKDVGFIHTISNPEIIINPDCIYIPALNKENAKKKYLKNKEQASYYKAKPIANIKDITL